MAFDPAPDSWIVDWSEDGTDVTFPLGSVAYLTAADADAATGDWRMCIALLLEHTLYYYNNLAEEDRPTQVTLNASFHTDSSGDIYRTISLTAKVSTLMVGATFTPDPE